MEQGLPFSPTVWAHFTLTGEVRPFLFFILFISNGGLIS